MRIALAALGAIAAGVLVLVMAPGSSPLERSEEVAAPLVLAHRGGMGLWPENTLHAFRSALGLGVDVLELDVRRSAEGRLMVFHDAHLDRTTDGSGPLAARTRSQLSQLDAGFGFTRDEGRSFPFRGNGLRIPTLERVLRAFPGARLSIELKDGALDGATALCDLVERQQAAERVLVASFHQEPIDVFRKRCPEVATAATPGEAWRFLLASVLRIPRLARPPADVLFLFERLGPFRPVTRRLVSHASALDLRVYVWGVQGEDALPGLLQAGVAGITTDRPDRLLSVLRSRATAAGVL